MTTISILLGAYFFIGLGIWFSPHDFRLTAVQSPWYCKMAFCLLWPLYLLSRPTGIFVKTMTFVLFCLITIGIVIELTKEKVYSLNPLDIREVRGFYLPEPVLPVEEIIKQELVTDKEKYLSALNQKSPDALITLVDTPVKAATAIMLYTVRNGVMVGTAPNLNQIHNGHRPIDCYGAAIIAAALLADDGFSPMFLSLKTSPRTFFFDITQSSVHLVYIYKSSCRFGYISLQKTTYPIFNDLNELIADVSAVMKVTYTQYFLFDFNKAVPDLETTEIWNRTEQADFWDYFL